MDTNLVAMQYIRDRQTRFGEEPIYCAAYDEAEEIFCLGSDAVLSRSERIAKRLRYEDQALRFLGGQRPMLFSAALRGPFERASGWRNPWLSQQQSEAGSFVINTAPGDRPLGTAVISKSQHSTHRNLATIRKKQTPTTTDWNQCHLPSPDSNRALDLAEQPRLDTEARSRIHAWASNLPSDAIERDCFWAPDDGTGQISEVSGTSKRPADKDWLRSKLGKRRRTKDTSFETPPSPTSAPAHKGRVHSVKDTINDGSPPRTHGKGNQNLPEPVVIDKTGPKRDNASQRLRPIYASMGNQVAVKASAFWKSSEKGTRKVSRTSSCLPPRDARSVSPGRGLYPSASAPPNPTSTAEQGHDCAPASSNAYHKKKYTSKYRGSTHSRLPFTQEDSGFESHLDHSLQHKARTTKDSAFEPCTIGAVGNKSQVTQTGTPESEDQDESVATRKETADSNEEDHGLDLQHHFVHIRTAAAANLLLEQGSTELVCADTLATAMNESSNRNEVKESSLNLGEGTLAEKTAVVTEQNGHDPRQQITDSLRNSQDDFPRNSLNKDSDETVSGSIGSSSRRKLHGIVPETMIDGNSTIVQDSEGVDTSGPKPMAQTPEGLDSVNSVLQAPPHLEVVSTMSEKSKIHDTAASWESYRTIRTEAGQPTEIRPLSAGVQKAPFANSQNAPGISFDMSNNTTNHNRASPDAPDAKMSDQASEVDNSVIVERASQLNLTNRNAEHSGPGGLGEGFAMRSAPDATKNEPPRHQEEETGPRHPDLSQFSRLSNDSPIKIEPLDNENRVTHPPPVGVVGSSAGAIEFNLRRQIFDTPIFNVISDASGLLQQQTIPEHVQTKSPVPVDEQSPWSSNKHDATKTTPAVTDRSPDRLHLSQSQSALTATRRNGLAVQEVFEAANSPWPSTGSEGLKRFTNHEQLATPTPAIERQLTPEPNLSIKSFATFNTPSPQRRQHASCPRLSGNHLPSTQELANAANSNPWDSLPSSLRSKGRRRSHLRVSFAMLPGQDEDRDIVDQPGQYNTRKAVSPPPQTTTGIVYEDGSDKFRKHFDAMKQKLATGSGTPKPTIISQLLPNESQQKPMSPEIGMMAQAFKDADFDQHPGCAPAHNTEVSDVVLDVDNEVQDGRAQSPWRTLGHNQGIDDVADVLQNLDEFLNPRWDMEPVAQKVKGADGLENREGNRSLGLFDGNVWDAL